MSFIQNPKISLLLCFINITSAFSQTPGKDSLFIGMMSSTIVRYGEAPRAYDYSAAYGYKLGAGSEFKVIRDKEFRKIICLFPESCEKYSEGISHARQAKWLGAAQILSGLVAIGGAFGSAISFSTKKQTRGLIFLAVGVTGTIGYFSFKHKGQKKLNNGADYLAESVNIYNSHLKK